MSKMLKSCSSVKGTLDTTDKRLEIASWPLLSFLSKLENSDGCSPTIQKKGTSSNFYAFKNSFKSLKYCKIKKSIALNKGTVFYSTHLVSGVTKGTNDKKTDNSSTPYFNTEMQRLPSQEHISQVFYLRVYVIS